MKTDKKFIKEKVPNDIEIISRMLCYGISISNDDWISSTTSTTPDRSFIQGSVFMFNRIRPVNTTIEMPAKSSSDAIPLVKHNGKLWIHYRGREIPCPILKQPVVLDEIYPGYGRIGDFLKYHSPNTIFGTPVRECVFGAIGKPCLFCTFEMVKPKPLPPEIFGDMFEKVRNRRNDVSLALGPGTPNLRDHGIRYFSNLLRTISNEWDGGISIELVPPHDINDLKLLLDSNVGSIVMSIEVWDDEQRAINCPGKSYISKSHYIAAWTYLVERLGRGKVSSVLLIGLDSDDNIKSGIDAMCGLGVVPTLIPFRPYDGTPLEGHKQTNYISYMDISRYNIHVMNRNSLHPGQQVGCTACGGCSIDIENLASFEALQPRQDRG